MFDIDLTDGDSNFTDMYVRGESFYTKWEQVTIAHLTDQ